MLFDELPDSQLVEAHSIVELRIAPERLTTEIADFIDDCWRPRPAARRQRPPSGLGGEALHRGHQLVELGLGLLLSSPATASATQWRTCPSRTRMATCSSAVWTAATCVRTSTQ